MKTCDRCSAFWIDGSATCRFCGHDPATAPIAPTPAANGIDRPPVRRSRKGDAAIIAGTIVTLVLMASAGLVLIGSSDGPTPSPPPSRRVTIITTTTAPPPPHALASVCDGTGHPDAAAYDPAHGGTRAFRMVRESDRWQPHTADRPMVGGEDGSGTRVTEDDFPLDPTIDLVLCITEGEVPAQTDDCLFYVEGTRKMLQIQHHTAHVTLRAARTAEVVHQTEILGTTGCPRFIHVERGARSVDFHPSEREIAAVAEPFLAGP